MVRPRFSASTRDGSILRRLFGERGGVDSGVREATVVAVTSGKGGTGKSFVTSNLAVELSRQHRRTTVVDCDFGLGNAHLLFGLNPRLTLQHVLARQATIEEVRCASAHGPALVPAGSGISRLADLSEREFWALAQGLAGLARTEDVLLLDTAAGISPQCLLTLLVADYVVLVTNPEIAALTDAYALVKCLARQPHHPEIGVIVNRVIGEDVGRVTFEKLADVSLRFSGCRIHYLGAIPEDPAVTQRRLGQPPLLSSHPDGETARCIRANLERLQGMAGGLRPRVQRTGILDRFQVLLATRQPAGHP